MKRAVAIARALAQDPEAILVRRADDDGRSAHGRAHGRFDPRLKEKFHKTSIVVTHDTHLARKLADKVVFLQDGKSTFFSSVG